VTDTELTLHEAAALLGVHYMTAYRYVRLGLLVATKTGGSWHVATSDIDEFRRVSSTGAAADHGGRRRAQWDERLESRLLAGDARGAWGVIEAALASGMEPDQIYLQVISPALATIGQRWEQGEIDVSLEHRASGIVMRLIGRLGPRFVRRGRTRGAVVLGAAPGERHVIPVAMLADLVRGYGWDVSDLGGDVPESSFVHAALTTPDVVAVGVSVTTDECLDTAMATLAAIRAAAPDVLLVAGGAAVRDGVHAVLLGADAVAADGRSFAALLDGMSAVARPSSADMSDMSEPEASPVIDG